jgi:hypothetical protein
MKAMRTVAALLAATCLLLLLPTAAQARHRTHVVIHKQPPAVAQQPAGVVFAAIPVVSMFYDLARRVDCRGDVLGMGGAGFDAEPTTGNFLIPATRRGVCPAPAPVY